VLPENNLVVSKRVFAPINSEVALAAIAPNINDVASKLADPATLAIVNWVEFATTDTVELPIPKADVLTTVLAPAAKPSTVTNVFVVAFANLCAVELTIELAIVLPTNIRVVLSDTLDPILNVLERVNVAVGISYVRLLLPVGEPESLTRTDVFGPPAGKLCVKPKMIFTCP